MHTHAATGLSTCEYIAHGLLCLLLVQSRSTAAHAAHAATSRTQCVTQRDARDFTLASLTLYVSVSLIYRKQLLLFLKGFKDECTQREWTKISESMPVTPAEADPESADFLRTHAKAILQSRCTQASHVSHASPRSQASLR